MAFIIYKSGCYVRYIARELRVTSVFPNERLRSPRRNGLTVDVNWGCGPQVIGQYRTTNRILNANISNSVRKMRTFERLDAASLPHPRVVTDPRATADDVPFYMRGRYLGRTDGLSGGEGITVYERGQLPERGTTHDFFSQVVAKRVEARLHVAGGTVICEQVKLVPAGSNVLIRNHSNGARFSARPLQTSVSDEEAARAREIAVAAIAAVGLDFGAVDMALTQRGNWVIFETNSAPGLSGADDEEESNRLVPRTYDAYLEYFRQFVVEQPVVRKVRRRLSR